MESFLKKKFRPYRKYASASPGKTAGIAKTFSKLLKQGDVIGLLGGLGAGKTHFIKGAAVAFGFKAGDIVSPTFNLVKEHKSTGITIYHYDLYRLASAMELDKTGYRDYITDENAVTFIEWPDRIEETWKDFSWVVLIGHKGKNKRLISVFKKTWAAGLKRKKRKKA
jgi:tRNA threonylcarbamoyladenosine biosynthesis protein TsaE